jgi:hypothetical protein
MSSATLHAMVANENSLDVSAKPRFEPPIDSPPGIVGIV